MSVCYILHISPLERLFVLKLMSRTWRATKAKHFVGISLKLLRCGDPALPALYGYIKRACACHAFWQDLRGYAEGFHFSAFHWFCKATTLIMSNTSVDFEWFPGGDVAPKAPLEQRKTFRCVENATPLAIYFSFQHPEILVKSPVMNSWTGLKTLKLQVNSTLTFYYNIMPVVHAFCVKVNRCLSQSFC